MSKVLCVQAYDQLSSLVNKTAETVEVKLLQADSKEVQEQGYKPFVTYTTFYSVDEDAGVVHLVQLRHNDKQEGETLTPGRPAIGFRGDVLEQDVDSDKVDVGEDDVKSFTLTLAQVIQSGLNATERSIQELLGVDLKALLDADDLTKLPSAFMDASFNEERHAYELGFSVLVKLTGQQLAYLMHSVTEHQSPFKLVDVMSLKMDMIVEEMDLSATLGKICEELVEQHGMEEWSAKVLNYTTRIAIYEVLREVTYQDMLGVATNKKIAAAAAQQQAEEKIKADANLVASLVPEGQIPDEAQAASVEVQTAQPDHVADAQG